MTRTRPLVALVLLACLAGCAAHRGAAPGPATRQFTFAWPFVPEGDARAARRHDEGPGGRRSTPSPARPGARSTSPGSPTSSATGARSSRWPATFRASFDFLEVVGFRAGFAPDRPYQSWGDGVRLRRARRAALHQPPAPPRDVHADADGKVEGPFVTKHWRQDWRYEDPDLLAYRGDNTWATATRRRAARRGTWTQAVFQVDDSPRYEAYGRWQHFGNVSTWRERRRRGVRCRAASSRCARTTRCSSAPTGTRSRRPGGSRRRRT